MWTSKGTHNKTCIAKSELGQHLTVKKTNKIIVNNIISYDKIFATESKLTRRLKSLQTTDMNYTVYSLMLMT